MLHLVLLQLDYSKPGPARPRIKDEMNTTTVPLKGLVTLYSRQNQTAIGPSESNSASSLFGYDQDSAHSIMAWYFTQHHYIQKMLTRWGWTEI